MTRHEFLAALHELLKPQSYLEVGVQHGWSLQLSKAPITFGIDPAPVVRWPNIIKSESDTVWADDVEHGDDGVIHTLYPQGVDMAFIDGMHLFEYALRDFMGIERHVHAKSVVVFDDVLPRNQEEADRRQCPGDWTGDVWKISPVLRMFRPDLKLLLVDTQPTGILVVRNLGRATGVVQGILDRSYESLVRLWSKDMPVPDDVINRKDAWAPDVVLEEIRNELAKA